MSRYIEFRSPALWQSRKAPIAHNGNIPFLTPKGVRLDGEPLPFIDDSMVEKLHRALVEGRAMQRHGDDFDCGAFGALMQDTPPKLRAGQHLHIILPTLTTKNISPQDRSVTRRLQLGMPSHEGFIYRHVVAPAHIKDQPIHPKLDGKPLYFHKLNTNGPVCLSGLTWAMKRYRCSVAHQSNEGTALRVCNGC